MFCFVTAYLVGRDNNHPVSRIKQTASTKRILGEHDAERRCGKLSL